MDNMQDLDPKIYTVLWICPLKVEADAAYAALDNQHRGRWAQSDSNGKHYAPTAGDMCGHNVIIMTIPPGTLYGTTTATSIATEVRMSFPSIRIGLLVGIAAGLPNFSCNPPIDIRLGDVLVALSFDEKPPVVAYDLGKETGNAELELLRHGQALHLSESVLRSMFGNIWRSDAKTNGSASLMYYYNSIKDKAVSPGCSWEYPGCHEDIYFDVDEDGIEHEVTRDSRPDAMRSQVWYGSLGSGNRVMKDRRKSNQLRDRHNLIGLEMEAAGILNDFRVGVIRGVSDYADKHKKATFRPYAAIMAAAYAKLVMAFLTPDKLTPTPQTMQTSQ
ncbi:Nucleoside phosphorylase [Cordyceps fumosorosea ARSEF 2679]|uniref:Nucleoside phosphorylase n=1 Tax=Cordyceps fumosorosea (strain ARSEF 2679) TaxID=1081104 RepID=A0A162MY46_CORFA|nr:Nucleoside phosphorylase [Cordyceps fumosorosea ARSEF 2679]OAA72509.1 Nucleoside phosphorylase [Cordyceps fumosorosea ARSEF 2679]